VPDMRAGVDVVDRRRDVKGLVHERRRSSLVVRRSQNLWSRFSTVGHQEPFDDRELKTES
jgi:hypothetical protein